MAAGARVLVVLAVLALPMPVAATPDVPDFAVLAAWVVPEDPAEGEQVRFHARVTNLGAAGSTWIGLIVGDDGASPPYVALGPGEVREVSSAWTVTGSGPQTLRAVADPARVVDEPDEVNNVAEASFVVRAPDPVLADLRVVPSESLEPWAPLRVAISTSNLGTAPTRLEYAVRVVACPKALPFEAFATCEHVATLTVPPPQAVGEPRHLRADWHVVGDLGSFNVCASIAYPAAQLSDSNDGRCTEAAAWAPLPRGLRLL